MEGSEDPRSSNFTLSDRSATYHTIAIWIPVLSPWQLHPASYTKGIDKFDRLFRTLPRFGLAVVGLNYP